MDHIKTVTNSTREPWQSSGGKSVPLLTGEALACYKFVLEVVLSNASTRRVYSRVIWRSLEYWESEGRTIQEIDEAAIVRVLAFLGGSLSTRRLNLAALRCLLSRLTDTGVFMMNPSESVRIIRKPVPRNLGLFNPLLHDTIHQLIASIDGDELIDHRDRALLLTISCGIESVTVARILTSDFHYDEDAASLQLRSRGEEPQPLPMCVAHAIQNYFWAGDLAATPDAPLFRTVRGKLAILNETAMTPLDIGRVVKKRARLAGLPIMTARTLQAISKHRP